MLRFNTASAMVILLITFSSSIWAHDWMAPEDGVQRKNPVAPSTQSIAAGREVYSQFCAYCHGNDGREEMPSFRADLTEEEIWSTILYIDSLPNTPTK